MPELTALELASELARLAADNGRLAAKYADLAAACLRNDEARKDEIDRLSGEVAKVAGSIEKLRRDSHSDAETAAAIAAQELFNQTELAKLRKDKADRDGESRARRLEIWKVVATILITGVAVEAGRIVLGEVATRPQVEHVAPLR